MTLHYTNGRPDQPCPNCGRTAGWSSPAMINGQELVRCLGCGGYLQYAPPTPEPSAPLSVKGQRHSLAPLEPINNTTKGYSQQAEHTEQRRFRRAEDNEW